jgi:hypothetical protein
MGVSINDTVLFNLQLDMESHLHIPTVNLDDHFQIALAYLRGTTSTFWDGHPKYRLPMPKYRLSRLVRVQN